MRKVEHASVLLGYLVISFLYFGLRLLPHPGRALLGSGLDPQIFVWSFAWWPHAIGAGENPLVSHAVYAPDGINLAWATTVPALSVAFAPLTLAFGPALSYNVAALSMPALAAFTAYLLCRHLARSRWAAVAGGYLFGFSAYMLGQELGHLHMTAIFVLPLVALAVVRFVEGGLDGRGLAWRLGLLFGLQLWLSTEVALTLAVALVLMLALAVALLPDVRARLRALVRPLAVGACLAAVLAGPLLFYALADFYGDSINEPSRFSGDLLNLVVPTRLVAAGGSTFADTSARFPGYEIERGAYLGLPALAAVAWIGVRERRRPAVRLLLAALALAVLLTLGTALHVRGERVVALPWALVARVPPFNNVLPVRFAVFAALATSVIVALWTARSRGLVAVALPLLAVAALVPAVWRADYRMFPQRWGFFSDGLYRICVPRGENVAIFPFGFWGSSMLWQAESDFWFRQAGGYLRPKPPPDNLDDPTIRKLTYTLEQPTMGEIFAMAKAKGVGRILAVEQYAHPNGNQMHRLGDVQVLGGVIVAPACGHPPLGPSSRLLPPYEPGTD